MSSSKLIAVLGVQLLAMLLFGAALAEVPATNLQQPEPKPKLDLYGDPLPPGALLRLGTTRYRSADVWQLQFADQNKVLLASSRDGIQVWEARTGKLLRELSKPKGRVAGFAMSRDEKHLAMGGYDQATRADEPGKKWISFWDVDAGKETRVIEISMGPPWQLAFTPSGNEIVSCRGPAFDSDNIVQIWNVGTGVEIARVEYPKDRIYMALSPDGSTIAIARRPNTPKLYLWKWRSGAAPKELTTKGDVGDAVAFSPDGSLLAECRRKELRVWDTTSETLKHTVPLNAETTWCTHVAFSPDGKQLFVAEEAKKERSITQWDTTTWKCLGLFQSKVRASYLAVSPDSQLLASVGDGLRVWDLKTRKELSENDKSHREYITNIATDSNLIATSSYDGTIRLWDALTGVHRRIVSHTNSGRAIALAPDGKLLASSSDDNTVCIWDLLTGVKTHTLVGHGPGFEAELRFSPDGSSLSSWGHDWFLRKWDVKTGKLHVEHGLAPVGPDGKRTRPTGELSYQGPGAFSVDGTTFVRPSGNEYHFYDVDSGKKLFRLPTHPGVHVSGQAISADKRLMITCEVQKSKTGDDGWYFSGYSILIWELASRRVRLKLVEPVGFARVLAFSPDCRYFAVATWEPDHRIRLWDAATGRELDSIRGFRGSVFSLIFTADSTRLISGMSDATALVWEVKGKR